MTVVTSGASGTATRSSRSRAPQDSGAIVNARPREINCRSCAWSWAPCGIARDPGGVGRFTAPARTIDVVSETKTALITGANKGIGHEIAAGLGELG